MSSTSEGPSLSAKERLKQAIKDYGTTVIVFHVSISVLSLGACYLLVSGYVTRQPLLFLLFPLFNIKYWLAHVIYFLVYKLRLTFLIRIHRI